MSTLLERQVRVSRILTTSQDHARALEDPVRSKIVELLYRKALSAEQISSALGKAGHKKALTTVRHHIEVLKSAGLAEVARIDESRGAITKYYGTSARLLGFEEPADFDSTYSEQIESASAKIEKLLKGLAPKGAKSRGRRSPEYGQYLAVQIMNRAMARVLEGGRA
ncbi:MAG: winged helix-turn-helix domain-containing protein [Nitrosopumilus sp.]|nr:winged helix-turn-helix domain-containing protein [Nitrosopumilus sp.]MDA7957592.1 winged helix-turn-helix domain-containing protein [Nitrosopumilus sp.]